MGVGREEVGRAGVEVGEVAAPAAGDADLLGDLRAVIDQQDLQAALTGDRRTVKPGSRLSITPVTPQEWRAVIAALVQLGARPAIARLVAA